MKKKGIAITVLFMCLVFIFITASVGYEQNFDYSLENWMKGIRGDVYMRDVIIPGSHDAATYRCQYFDDTQDLSIYEQLLLGTRYFDLRVMDARIGDKEKHQNLRIFHSPFPSPTTFLEVAQEIRDFLNDNPSEFLILEFHSFRNQPYEQMTQVIEEVLVPEEYALKKPHNLLEMTFDDIRKSGAKYIILWGSRTSYENLQKDYLFSTTDVLNSPYVSYYHNQSNSKLVTEGFDHYYSRQDHRLFVLQSQRTPAFSFSDFFDSFNVSEAIPSALEQNFKPYASAFIEGLKTSPRLDITNIIMRDFINEQKTKSILELNLYKGTVKSQYIPKFQRLVSSSS